jgi:hypothetical protein
MLERTAPLVGSKWRERTVFTEISRLPSGFLDQMRAISKIESEGITNGNESFLFETRQGSPAPVAYH